jgi:hypothetical protein
MGEDLPGGGVQYCACWELAGEAVHDAQLMVEVEKDRPER